jgi:glycosyltransferase involved in cell wall biosynthesis
VFIRVHLWLTLSVARRILLLITDLEIGGTPTVVRELAIRLNDPPNVEIQVACLKSWGPNAERLRAAGIDVAAFDVRHVWQLPSAVRRLRELVRDRKIDSVFSFLIHANTVAALASRDLPGVRFLQSVQTTQPRPRWHWWLQGKIESAAEKIVVPSMNVDGALRVWSGVAPGRAHTIHNAVDAAAFQRQTVFAGDPVRVGFIGRMDPVKRLHIAMSAAAQIREFPLRMLIFGDGPYKDIWQSYQRKMSLDPKGDRFFWMGEVATPQEALRQMDVLLLPSIGEGFGLVLIEAMASGVPVIASAAGGIQDAVRHEFNGLLVPVKDAETLGFADAIRRLRNDVALRERLISNGLSDVRQRFSWETVLPQYQRLLRLLSSPGTPGEAG